MKIRIEPTDLDEEIVIRCKSPETKGEMLREAVLNAVRSTWELLLYLGTTEYYVPRDDVMFFETSDGKVYAHTAERMLRCEHKLFELCDIMPSYFVRISKSAIANVKLISSLSRELTGNGCITFRDSDKSVYFSRAYYRQLKDRIEEVRFLK